MVGPTVWAVAFALIYALHGVGCAKGWPSIAMPVGNLHQTVLVGSFVLAMLLAGWVLRCIPRGEGVKGLVIAAGGWIGLGGVVLTLFPVLGVSSCWA